VSRGVPEAFRARRRWSGGVVGASGTRKEPILPTGTSCFLIIKKVEPIPDIARRARIEAGHPPAASTRSNVNEVDRAQLVQSHVR